MGFLFSGVFWGVLVVLIGLSILLNAVVGVKIPIIPIVFGLFFIYLGITLLTGASWWRARRGPVVMEERGITTAKPADKHDIVFGRADIDLTRVTLGDSVFPVEVNTVFGASTIRVDRNMPVKVVATVAFSGVRLPDGSSIAFGDHTWRSDSLEGKQGYLLIKASVVFGGMEVIAR